MVSGGGALPKNIGEFFGDLGIVILEGFGLPKHRL
jgi:long-chain acyl-CoA synthetase